MRLLTELIASVPESGLLLDKAFFTPEWTLVVSSNCGLAEGGTTAHDENPVRPGEVSGQPLAELAPLALSEEPSRASLGIASLNALLLQGLKPGSFSPYGLPRASGKTVGLVGEFPFSTQLRELADEVILTEPGDAEYVLPRVDIAILSGSAIVNHTLEPLLAASRTCYTIVFGPSTPLSPVLFDFGADQLVGVTIKNHEEVAMWISAGMENLMECPGLKTIVLRK